MTVHLEDLILSGVVATQADVDAKLDSSLVSAAALTVLDDANVAAMRATLGLSRRAVSISIGDPNGSVIVAGVKAYVRLPFAWTDIASVTIVGDASGSIIWSVKKATNGNTPTFASIVSSAPPTLSGAVSSTDTTLTGWTKTGSAGDLLEIGVTGTPATVKLASLTIEFVV